MRGDFLATLEGLELQTDINKVLDYFSYEHFYVIYTNFWKLDKNHDLIITKSELACYGDQGLSHKALDRVFSGTVFAARGPDCVGNGDVDNGDGCMTYTDFVRFIIAEEDKASPTAIEYWFRVMDCDGDGVISLYELEYFYEEQEERFQELAVECMPFNDCLCQVLDMVSPRVKTFITLQDLRRCGHASIFFNTFLNVNKFLDFEDRDPFMVLKEREDLMEALAVDAADATVLPPLPTDWERFATREYMLLAAEEDDWSDGTHTGNASEYDDDEEYQDDF
eukprot:m.278169 g.278169  ORF g.278169 m.278169 type:complete len:280 (+) comp19379_c0_seq1:1172-2011(+)